MLQRHGRGRLHLRAAAVLVALLTAASAAAPAQAAGAPPDGIAQQLAVPAYFYPGGDGAALWQQLNNPGVGIAVANPFSGPGKTRDPNYAAAITAAKNAGVRALGYVATGYLGTTGRATRLNETNPAAWAAQVQQDVATWYRLYGADGLGGIFFDEVQNVCGPQDTYIDTYRMLDRHTKRANPGAFTVINPGIDTEPCYADAADVILTFEGTYETYLGWQPPAWHRALDPRKLWHLVHATDTTAQLANTVALSKQRNAGYLYVTPDVLANPWDSLPPQDYWTRQLSAASADGGDTAAPRVFGTPFPVRTGSTEAVVAWLPAADPHGRVTGYDVHVDGVRAAGSAGALPVATLHGLSPNRTYQITVTAHDAAGNISAPGRALSLTTARADASAPAAPAGLHAAETKVASVRLAWTASAEPDLAGYDVEVDGQLLLSLPSWLVTQGGTVTMPVSGLEPGTAYTFTAYARDRSGNRSAAAGAADRQHDGALRRPDQRRVRRHRRRRRHLPGAVQPAVRLPPPVHRRRQRREHRLRDRGHRRGPAHRERLVLPPHRHRLELGSRRRAEPARVQRRRPLRLAGARRRARRPAGRAAPGGVPRLRQLAGDLHRSDHRQLIHSPEARCT